MRSLDKPFKAFLIATLGACGAIVTGDSFPAPWKAWAAVYIGGGTPLLAYLLKPKPDEPKS